MINWNQGLCPLAPPLKLALSPIQSTFSPLSQSQKFSDRFALAIAPLSFDLFISAPNCSPMEIASTAATGRSAITASSLAHPRASGARPALSSRVSLRRDDSLCADSSLRVSHWGALKVDSRTTAVKVMAATANSAATATPTASESATGIAKPTVLVAEKLGAAGIQLLEKVAVVDCSYNLSHEDLCAKVSQCDALIVRSGTKVTREVFEASKGRLKVRRISHILLEMLHVELPCSLSTVSQVLVLNARCER